MSPNFTCDQISSFFKNQLRDIFCGALLYGDEALYIKPASVIDIATLPNAAHTCQKYLDLGDEDIIVMNDPYSGGTTVSSLTLIMGLGSALPNDKGQVYLIERIHFKPKVQMAQSVEQEGLKIPPTPLVQNGQTNQMFFEAMTAHPDAPDQFKERLAQALDHLQTQGRKLKTAFKSPLWSWSKKDLKTYLKMSYELVQKHLQEWSTGEKSLESRLIDSTKIKLRLEVSDDTILFDFSGTTPSKHWNLTDSAATGACIGAVLTGMGHTTAVNSGTLKAFQVLAPSGSLVNAKYPAPTYAGMTDGAPFIANLALQGLSLFAPDLKMAQSASSHCAFNLEFANGSHFYDSVTPGVAASHNHPGLSGIDLWHKHHREPSAEEIERRFPLRIKTFGYRQNSGGSGHLRGGDGMLKIFELLEPAKLTWTAFQLTQPPGGEEGGKSAQGADIYIQKPSGEKRKLESEGTTSIESGELLIVQSAGGGGYGDMTEGV